MELRVPFDKRTVSYSKRNGFGGSDVLIVRKNINYRIRNRSVLSHTYNSQSSESPSVQQSVLPGSGETCTSTGMLPGADFGETCAAAGNLLPGAGEASASAGMLPGSGETSANLLPGVGETSASAGNNVLPDRPQGSEESAEGSRTCSA